MSNTKQHSRNLLDAIENERYDQAEDAFTSVFANKAAPRLEQERVAVAKDFLGKRFDS